MCGRRGAAGSGTVLGAALLRVDVGLQTLGWLTVAAHVWSVSLVQTLPDARWIAAGPTSERGDVAHIDPDPRVGGGPVSAVVLDDVSGADPTGSYAAWWSTLTTGVGDARRSPTLSRLVVLGAILSGLFILDEYLPLLVRARGGGDAIAPVVVLAVWVGLLIGGEVAARYPAIRSRTLGLLLTGSMALTSVAFLSDSIWLLALVAVAYACLELAWVATDARLQERSPAATRATVTSVRGFGSATISMIAFVVIGAMAAGDDPTPGHLPVLGVLAVTGAVIVRWLPEPAQMDG